MNVVLCDGEYCNFSLDMYSNSRDVKNAPRDSKLLTGRMVTCVAFDTIYRKQTRSLENYSVVLNNVGSVLVKRSDWLRRNKH